MPFPDMCAQEGGGTLGQFPEYPRHRPITAPAVLMRRLLKGEVDLSLEAMLLEILSNARIAGARTVAVHNHIRDRRIVIQDDGEGIADPDGFSRIGHVGWTSDTSDREASKGLGRTALLLRGAEIQTRHRSAAGGYVLHAHQTDDEPIGRLSINPNGSGCFGTMIEIDLEDGENALDALEKAARCFSLPVTYSEYDRAGEVLESFVIQGRPYVGKDEGYELEDVSRLDAPLRACAVRIPLDHDMQSHERTAGGGLPRVTLHNGSQTTTIGVAVTADHPAQLEDTALLEAHKENLQLIAYRGALAVGGGFCLGRRDRRHAMELGCDVPMPAAALTPWTPKGEGPDHDAAALAAEAAVVGVAIEESDVSMRIMVDYAMRRSGVSLYRETEAFEGDPWYDDLPRLIGVSLSARRDGERLEFTQALQHIERGLSRRAATVVEGLELNVGWRTSFMTETRTYPIPAAVLALGRHIDDVSLLLSRYDLTTGGRTTVDTAQLVERIMLAVFHSPGPCGTCNAADVRGIRLDIRNRMAVLRAGVAASRTSENALPG